jgi:heptosyltransferase-2
MLFGGPGEDDLVQGVLSPMIRPPICAVIPRLRQFAALVERCSLFLCNDSGPMHIAAALKVPTVAVFGPTDYVRWKPRNENAVIVRKDVDCWPCGAHKCERGFECTKSLPVNDVLDAGCSILDAR